MLTISESRRIAAGFLFTILFLSFAFSACGGESNNSTDDSMTGKIVINEIDCYSRDWVELVNTTAAEIDISGFFVSDDPSKDDHIYELPKGTLIQPLEHLVIKQAKDSEPGFSFGIKCGADTLYFLNKAKSTIDQVKVGDAAEGNTWGRLPDMTGSWQETYPTESAANQAPLSASSVLFDPLTVNTIDLTLDQASLDALSADPYTYVQGQITLATLTGKTGPLVTGVRLKSGESFEPISGKASFKIKINEIESDNRIFGLKVFNLNSMVDDPSMMHETMAYAVFRNAGVPAIRTGYAWVTVNGEAYGLYTTIESYDDVFSEMHFSNMQHIYEGMSDLYATEIASIEADEGDKADKSDLTALITAINGEDDAAWMAQVSALMDIDHFASMWAIENYIGQTDGYTMAANNYFLHSSKKGYFTMMPWGLDKAFTGKPEFPTCNRALCTKCQNNPECLVKYNTALNNLKGIVMTMDPDRLITSLETVIASYVKKDARKPYSAEEHATAVESLRTFFSDRSIENTDAENTDTEITDKEVADTEKADTEITDTEITDNDITK